ncbi:hypothetical protein GT347_13140 [Xylophilus rhododendri]|uniref:TraB/GumN family protein n=1 Tax=Xylophilus rhododendri TaxID=2697032 RepID=A0A857J733_9BURK|nr:TraB/GumN family protein [Xylophilus rhododendri]QHI98851.1 hypothetical protein GT347_13140 [Xylophilus rhododendri]
MIFELDGGRIRVMGTLHLLPPGRQLPPWVRSAYDWSEAVFVEHSASDFLRLAQPEALPVEQQASAGLLKRLRDIAGPSPMALERMHRGAAVVMALASRLSGRPGADMALHDWAQQDGKPFGYVEQASEVLAVLDGIAESDWLEGIAAELARPQTSAQQLQGFYDAWRKGRLEQIAEASEQGLLSRPAIRQRMLLERNRAWAARYAAPQQRCLIAVGAAHLVGAGSFLETLAQASGGGMRRIV